MFHKDFHPYRAIKDFIARSFLLKKGLRDNRIWGSMFFRHTFLKNIAIVMDTYALLRSQYWSQQEIRALQLERMKDLVIHADRKIPFWRDKFSEAEIHPETAFDWDDFSRIPITKKTDFKNKLPAYFTDKELFAQEHFVGKTSGSTAEPFVFFQDYHFELRSFAICRRIISIVSGGKLLPVIHVRGRPRYGFAEKGNWFFVYSYNHIKYRLEQLVQLAEKLKSHFIVYTFVSYAVEIARLCDEKHIPFSPAAVIVCAEGIRPYEREFIESKLKTNVFNLYSTNDLGWVAQDCEKKNLHINSESAYVEIVDKDGVPLENGQEGRVIVTTFDNKIMPFIRYDIGDLGMLSVEPCACGRTLPQLKIIGRQTDMIMLPGNRRVSVLDVLNVFWDRFELIRQYQLIQKSLDEFVVKIIPEGDIDDNQLSEIANHLRSGLHPGIKIVFELVEEIPAPPSGKKIPFKSLIGIGNA